MAWRANRDPEQARQQLGPVLECMMDVVHRYEGTTNQVLGDGMMVWFGVSIVHEDHAVRACHAMLAMQTAVKQYAAEVQRTHGVPILSHTDSELHAVERCGRRGIGSRARACATRPPGGGARPHRGARPAPAGRPLPPWPWYAVCQVRPAGAGPAELSTALALYQTMDMTFWLPQVEAALAQVEGR
jgi:hypothetical protein